MVNAELAVNPQEQEAKTSTPESAEKGLELSSQEDLENFADNGIMAL